MNHASRIFVSAALLSLCLGNLALAAELQDLRRVPPISGDAQAGATKAATCIACHGPEGRSLVPVYPSLAGQSATYTYLQLRQFKNGQRTSESMSPFVGPLTETDLRDVAAYFAAQTARPAVSGATNEAGRELFARGDPARGLPPCQGCHGRDGIGMPPAEPGDRVPWHSFPKLAGQQPDYLVQQLEAFKNGTRSGTTAAALMQTIAQNMDAAAMQAVAAHAATAAIAQQRNISVPALLSADAAHQPTTEKQLASR
jgi:cytochrome c553